MRLRMMTVTALTKTVGFQDDWPRHQSGVAAQKFPAQISQPFCQIILCMFADIRFRLTDPSLKMGSAAAPVVWCKGSQMKFLSYHHSAHAEREPVVSPPPTTG